MNFGDHVQRRTLAYTVLDLGFLQAEVYFMIPAISLRG